MDHNILSYNFVGIWSQFAEQIPLFDNKFSKDLFGDPYNTSVGVTQVGFTIVKKTPLPPNPMVVITPQLIQITSTDSNEVCITLSKIATEIEKAAPTFNFKFGTFGLNTEHEFLNLGVTQDRWINDQFPVNSNLAKLNASIKEITFEMPLKDGDKLVTLIQPRASLHDALFLRINHHHERALSNIESLNQLGSLYQESLRMIQNKIFVNLNLNQ
jgi:hypothetical protein